MGTERHNRKSQRINNTKKELQGFEERPEADIRLDSRRATLSNTPIKEWWSDHVFLYKKIYNTLSLSFSLSLSLSLSFIAPRVEIGSKYERQTDRQTRMTQTLTDDYVDTFLNSRCNSIFRALLTCLFDERFPTGVHLWALSDRSSD